MANQNFKIRKNPLKPRIHKGDNSSTNCLKVENLRLTQLALTMSLEGWLVDHRLNSQGLVGP